jgi:hypothetical protein
MQHDGGFAPHMEKCLPVLFRSLYVTIKVINGSSDECIRELLRLVHTERSLEALLNGATTDTHAIVRQRCGEYLAQYLQQCTQRNVAAPQDEALVCGILGAVSKTINDSDKGVRHASRRLFAHVCTFWPAEGAALFDSFAKPIQRTITSEQRKKQKKST